MTYDELVLCLMRLPHSEHISDIQNCEKEAFFVWRGCTYSVSLNRSIFVMRKADGERSSLFTGDSESILMECVLKRIYINLKIGETDDKSN